ncbi:MULTISPECIES: Asp23/Gls24 family envelope stress response protein [Jeotgalicoccus]|jgi:uncharacterized alkaline shock family protein YloU|uniref:Asp23/Gls24 family envelope stress response protein n=1 Tax=Jeotgalicoccus TaxID=227979 RepID=UPI0004195685|nr:MULTISPECIES: Asp23/Gls24 family envelope stress response protein [Jeotgalicoccus]MDO5360950.1 Asp23/Gls24 family envelope stress response protein [Jeotgalicoccus sp.]HBV22462.1 Asp23/Gls24 family envelope stress response protein [Jeotgalicoccus sp.]
MILQNHKTNLGSIEISSEVIEVIASIAVEETKGVHSLQNNFASGNIEKIGKKFRGRGVKVETKDDQIHIAIYVVLSTDRNVHSVAERIQENVKQAVNDMLEVTVNETNVHIVNIIK